MDGEQSNPDSNIIEVRKSYNIIFESLEDRLKKLDIKICSHFQMNNATSVLHKIANMYAEQLMSDICLVVGENKYPAHRVILCASSEVFQVMLGECGRYFHYK